MKLSDEERRRRRSASSQKWRRANAEKAKALWHAWADANAEHRDAWRKAQTVRRRHVVTAQQKRRYHSDPAFKAQKLLRARISSALRAQGAKKDGSLWRLLGCDAAALRSHLERQFTDGMTWDNYGKWHVDHKKPCASFDLSDPVQQAECFHYTNLQPLWARDNRRKYARL